MVRCSVAFSAVLLGAAAYMFTELAELPGREDLFPAAPVVVTDPEMRTSVSTTTDVSVLLEFVGRGVVVVDGYEVGTWEDQVRLSLPLGKHQIEVRMEGETVVKEVMLLPNTSPVFDMRSSP